MVSSVFDATFAEVRDAAISALRGGRHQGSPMPGLALRRTAATNTKQGLVCEREVLVTSGAR